jgi:hypothetical protein
MHPVVLAGGRTPVRVVVRGFGLLRVGDVRKIVVGSFDGVVFPHAAARIEVRFGFTRCTLDAVVVPAPAPHHVAVAVASLACALHIPRPSFAVTVQLHREEHHD